MDKEFCTYSQALRLKALGFDEPCFGFWSKIHGLFITNAQGKLNENAGECLAPTFSQAFRWFREKHDLACYIYRTNFTSYEWVIDIDESYAQDSELDYTSYEKAELACLDKLLEIVESTE